MVNVDYIKCNQLSIYDSKIIGNDNCYYCDLHIPYRSFRRTKDHFYPKSCGGKLIVICCMNCNSRKNKMKPIQYIEYIKGLCDKHRKSSKNHPFIPIGEKIIERTQHLWEKVKWSIN